MFSLELQGILFFKSLNRIFFFLLVQKEEGTQEEKRPPDGHEKNSFLFDPKTRHDIKVVPQTPGARKRLSKKEFFSYLAQRGPPNVKVNVKGKVKVNNKL